MESECWQGNMLPNHGTPQASHTLAPLQLPDEILEMVSMFLKSKDALNLSTTCRRLRQMVLLLLNSIVLAELREDKVIILPSGASELSERRNVAQQSQDIQRQLNKSGGWSLMIVYWLHYRKWWLSCPRRKKSVARARRGITKAMRDDGNIHDLDSALIHLSKLREQFSWHSAQVINNIDQSKYREVTFTLYQEVAAFIKAFDEDKVWLDLSDKIFIAFAWYIREGTTNWDQSLFAVSDIDTLGTGKWC